MTESEGHPVVETLSSALAQMPGWFARHTTPERLSGRDQNMVMMNFKCMATKFDKLQQDIMLPTSASSPLQGIATYLLPVKYARSS